MTNSIHLLIHNNVMIFHESSLIAESSHIFLAPLILSRLLKHKAQKMSDVFINHAEVKEMLTKRLIQLVYEYEINRKN